MQEWFSFKGKIFRSKNKPRTKRPMIQTPVFRKRGHQINMKELQLTDRIDKEMQGLILLYFYRSLSMIGYERRAGVESRYFYRFINKINVFNRFQKGTSGR